MEAYLHGTDVQLVVPLKDKNGNAMDVTSVEYRVTDETGAELIARTAVADFVAGEENVIIAVPAISNVLALGQARALRAIDLYCEVATNIVVLSAAYAIEQTDPLVVGVNSFQGYAGAQFVALEMPNVVGWDTASEGDRIAALIDARDHICQLSFPILSSGDLESLTLEEFNRLPSDFRTALNKAQIAEANVILGGDPVEAKRQDGLLLDSIGESRQMFRPGKPLSLPVSRRALSYLSQFVTFSKRIGRV